MAHAAILGGLTEALVTLITATSAQSDPARFSVHRESALRGLRHHSFLRTNQFDVSSQLRGLQEKFQVYNKDNLADALGERVEALSNLGVKWESETLHLLLELSDRPVVNSNIEDLNSLKEPEVDIGLPLQWKELLAEDQLLRDKHVWRNVDFGAESSEVDEFEDSGSELSEAPTFQSSVGDEGVFRLPENQSVETRDENELRLLRKAQFWLKAPSVGGVRLESVKKPVTELQAIREVLFMLSGLPTSLFVISPGVIDASRAYCLKHASWEAYYKVAESLADQGSKLMVLRSWSRQPQAVPLLQVLQCSVGQRVSDFDANISKIQHGFVSLAGDITVSLLKIQSDVTQLLGPLLRLSAIVGKLESEPYAHKFRYFELLYDETCISQMAGDMEMYAFMGTIFFDCFQLYLRPIRVWMEEGELSPGDSTFFVSEATGRFESASVWESQYKIRHTQDKTLHAPRFLRAAANKIFTTGKSVVVLKKLNQFVLLQSGGRIIEPTLNFETVCNIAELQLAPFPELFDVAFDAWVQSKHRHASLTLRWILFDGCGLRTALDAFFHIYFMSDGATAAVFTNSVFDKLDTLDGSWNDRFTLTELAQSTFGTLQPVVPDKLRIKILNLPRKYQNVTECRRSVKVLSVIQMTYQLPWPIQLIIKPEAVSSYQRVSIFLSQIRRSTHILSRNRLVKDILNHTSSSDERALYYSLRTRLLWFNQTLYHYLTALVLEPCSQTVRDQLKGSTDVDAMIGVHTMFIKTVINQALLGSKLELIQKTILKILDLGIKLEDAQAANTATNQDALEQQQEMMDLSMAGLGLETPRRKGRSAGVSSFGEAAKRKDEQDTSSDEDEKDINVDLSILSSAYEGAEDEMLFLEKLRSMKGEFDRLIRFVAAGLKGVARAGGGEEAKSWDLLGEMLDLGIGTGVMRY